MDIQYFVVENDILMKCTDKNILTADIPNGVTVIDKNAFSDCKNLISVTFPTSVKKIKDGAFQNCISLSNVDLSNVDMLGAFVFNGCSGLQSVTFGENIEYLCNGTFANCVLLNNISLPENIIYIGCECFQNCNLLTSVEIYGVREIDNAAFEYCDSLYSVNLPDSLFHISSNAFSFCKNLKSVTIYNQFIDIEENAFENTTDIVIKASAFSSAYRFAVDNGYKCLPAILNECYRKTESKYIRHLISAGVMFQMKPNPENNEEFIIRFDKLQEKTVDSILKKVITND